MNNNYRQKPKRQNVSYAKQVRITQQNYVDEAENAIKDLEENKVLLSTSKIRNILSMVSDLYNDAKRSRSVTLDEEMKSRIQYLRMRFAYEAGREEKVKHFAERADIFNNLKGIGDSTEQLLLFCHYMEALVAYHRYYGGKELNR